MPATLRLLEARYLARGLYGFFHLMLITYNSPEQ